MLQAKVAPKSVVMVVWGVLIPAGKHNLNGRERPRKALGKHGTREQLSSHGNEPEGDVARRVCV